MALLSSHLLGIVLFVSAQGYSIFQTSAKCSLLATHGREMGLVLLLHIRLASYLDFLVREKILDH